MPSPRLTQIVVICAVLSVRPLLAQQPVDSTVHMPVIAPGVTADGTALPPDASPFLLAEQTVDSSIERSRLYNETPTTIRSSVNADGSALPDADTTTSSDDSFGAQVILKNQERLRTFAVSGGISTYYTTNAALARSGEIDDVLGVIDAAATWTPKLSSNVEAQMGLHSSTFRYADTSELDFTSIGFSAGILWAPQNLPGVNVFARYDFNELVSSHGRELLRDHEWTLGAQKVFALGRSHFISVGTSAGAGVSEPFSAQRDQVGAFVSYHLRIARHFDADASYRFAYYFYNSGDRRDANQFLSLGMRYQLAPWANLVGTLALGINRSNQEVFDYDVLNTGGGIGVNVSF